MEFHCIDDDTAYDALVDLRVSTNIIGDMEKYLDDDEYFEWTKTLRQYDFSPLKQKARIAIEAVLSNHSE